MDYDSVSLAHIRVITVHTVLIAFCRLSSSLHVSRRSLEHILWTLMESPIISEEKSIEFRTLLVQCNEETEWMRAIKVFLLFF